MVWEPVEASPPGDGVLRFKRGVIFMSNIDKPSDIHPLYGVWINGVIKRLRADIEVAEREARQGLQGGHLNPTQKQEVEAALRALEQAERALGVAT